MENELVRFKGMVDGVRINIDDTADIYGIADALEMNIMKNKSFFGDGNCKIRLDGRKLTAGERMRLEDVIKRLLPMSVISFGGDEPKPKTSGDWVSEYKERKATKEQPHKYEEDKLNKVEKLVRSEDFLSVFRSNRAKLFQGFVRNGETVTSDGHLILLGSAEVGSELSAVGSIIVIGGLYGSAHAGCNGHNGSYILAMDMRPTELKIAKIAAQYTYEEKKTEEPESEEKEKRRIFDKLKRNRDVDPKPEEPEQTTEVSAIALVKNNKIELDNFTIKTFTNSENML